MSRGIRFKCHISLVCLSLSLRVIPNEQSLMVSNTLPPEEIFCWVRNNFYFIFKYTASKNAQNTGHIVHLQILLIVIYEK